MCLNIAYLCVALCLHSSAASLLLLRRSLGADFNFSTFSVVTPHRLYSVVSEVTVFDYRTSPAALVNYISAAVFSGRPQSPVVGTVDNSLDADLMNTDVLALGCY